MPKVMITDYLFNDITVQKDIIESAGLQFEALKPGCRTEDEVIAACGSADALLVQFAPVTKRVMEALPNAKLLVRYGVGVDNLDLAGAKELGVMVANVPDFCTEEVSNHAVALILSLARKIPQDSNNILMSGGWGIGPFMPIHAPTDTTLGLVGFGRIPRSVAQKAKAFGFKIIASDPYAPDSLFAELGVEKVDVNTLFKTSDIVSLHCPLTPETTRLVDKEQIASMKDGVILVNTARGGVVNEAELVAALQSGKISSAGLDVFEVEPLPETSPLRGMKNVILTSHAASASSRATLMLQTKAAEAARDFLTGKRPVSVLVG